MVNSAGISCGACMWPIGPEAWNQPGGVSCPRCSTRVEVMVFPAMQGLRAGLIPEAIQSATEATCFYHAENRAATPCEVCGRFLCRLCEIPMEGKILCPSCFSSGARSRTIRDLDKKRMMYDTIALLLATLPGLFVWPSVLGVPAALYLAIRYWRAPSSLVPRTRIRYYLAILFALAELAGVVAIIYALTQIPRPIVR